MRDRTFTELRYHLPRTRRSFVMPGKHAFETQQNARRRAESGIALERIAHAAERDPERARRIAELKSQIRNGTYRPNLQKVAERLLPDLFPERPER